MAVIDTGIAPVPGLDQDDKVLDGPDLSFDGQSADTRYLDGYGHGTHMAGIIAGEDDHFDPKRPDPTMFAGVAPDAQLLNMKVGAGDGGVDVTQVIAALDWVVQHRDDQGMNVRVINLAYGTESLQPWQVDPLAKAVENAWDHGIVVVAAAGNDGLDAPNLLMPAVDPHVIAVGAVDHEGTAATDRRPGRRLHQRRHLGSPTGRAGSRQVGRVAARARLVRRPGAPRGPRARATPTGRYFRGSGTSQATAVVAGEVALLLQAQAEPHPRPGQVRCCATPRTRWPAAPARDGQRRRGHQRRHRPAQPQVAHRALLAGC